MSSLRSVTNSKLLGFKNFKSLVFDVFLSKTRNIVVFWQALIRLIRVLVLLPFISIPVIGQDTIDYFKIHKSDNFNQAHSPFTDPLTMWFQQQNFTCDQFQIDIRTRIPLSEEISPKTQNVYYGVYLPVVKYKGFRGMIGGGYSKNILPMMKSDSVLTFQELTPIWIPLQYTNKKWRFTLLIEMFYKGNSESVYTTKTGNLNREFFIVNYALSKKWQISGIAAAIHEHKEGNTKSTYMPGFQVRYKPSKDLKILFGAPIIFSTQWTINEKIDLYFSNLLFEETESFLTYNFTKNIGLTLYYKYIINNWSDYYLPKSTLTFTENQILDYNRFGRTEHSTSLRLSLRTTKNIGLGISFGYKFGDDIGIYLDENSVGSFQSKNQMFLGINIQYLNLL